MEQKKFIQANISFGQWIYNMITLNFLTLFYTFKGALIFGLFPAFASLMHIFYKWIVHKEYDLSISTEFKTFYHKNFWEANKLGGLLTVIGIVLLLDLYISIQFIQSIIIHSLLLILFILFLMVSFYLFPVFARYAYSQSRDYVKQAFFISLSSFIQSAAILVALIAMSYVFYSIPFLLLFFGIPIIFGGIGWFAYQGILRAEKMKMDQKIKP